MDGYGTTSNWWPRYQGMPSYSRQKDTPSASSNEALTESSKTAEPTNWIQKVSIFAIVFVILASIAVAIAVPMLISRGPRPDDVEIFFNIRILDEYKGGFNNSATSEYKSFAITLCRALIPVLNGPGQIGANYVSDSCQVLSLRNGSIIARVTSRFRIVDTRQTSLNAVQNNIFRTFVHRVDNGTFGLPVDKTAFTISGHSQSMTAYDPCNPSLTTCDQICTSSGSNNNVQCSCFDGYKLNGDTCEGVDICGLGLDKCDHKTTYCMNGEYQTFTCPCLAGYKPGPTVAPPAGQPPPTPTSCIDIDECVEQPWVCNANTSTCNNTIGGYMCNCLPGYAPSTAPFMANVCLDIDECWLQMDHCDYTTTTCVNTLGNYTCACRPGFDNYANYYCSNIDECNTLQPCNTNTSMCMDTFGSYWCKCMHNFTQNADGSCTDMDECALGRDMCNVYNQTCLNNFGGYTCPCKVGFNLTSSGDCMDINECAMTPSPCPYTNCSNTLGSYYCFCPAGYNLITNSTNISSCQDINECATLFGGCDLTERYCQNTPGSFNCNCKFSNLMVASDPNNGCEIGESGFFIKSTASTLSGAIVSYDTLVSNFGGFLPGNGPFTSFSTNAYAGNYWVYQTLAATSTTAVTPSWGSTSPSPVVVSVSPTPSTYDMTSAGFLLGGNNAALSTALNVGTSTGDGGVHDTSLLAFYTASISGYSESILLNYTFPINVTVTVPPSLSAAVPVFISLTTQAPSGYAHVAQLISSSNSQVLLQNRFDRINSSANTVTSAAIVMLAPGSNIMSLQLVSGSMCTNTTYPCSLSYFTYSPNDARFTTVYWSVYRSSPLAFVTTPTTIGFDIASVVGQAGLWDNLNNAIVAPVTGAYYININAATQPAQNLDVRLYINGVDAKIGLLSNVLAAGVVSKSRGAIVMLNQGDRATLVANAVTGVYGDTNWPSSSFTGFLLYARQ